MHTELRWIDGPWKGRLAVAARPRGGDWIEDEINAWRDAGVDVVVSLVTSQESMALDLEREEEVCRAAGIEFISFPIEDRTFPDSDSATMNLTGRLASSLDRGKNAVAHCRQGVGRSNLVAIGTLLYEGSKLDTAVAEVGRARGVQVPETAGQLRWLSNLEAVWGRTRILRTG